MKIKFSMDEIKSLDLIYTWSHTEQSDLGFLEEDYGEVQEEQYHGTDYCKRVISDVVSDLREITEYDYIGQSGRIANETFTLKSDKSDYSVFFAVNTYDGKGARIECTIISDDCANYDKDLEKLKIILKNRLINDWRECTWLLDEQSELLCREAYQKAYHVENNLRAFASKVLIHFLGVNWIGRAGLEKYEKSVRNLQDEFTQRVPDFDNINTDFLSMTLETLVEIIFDGKVYNEEIKLTREQYNKIQEMGTKASSPANISEYIKKRRELCKNIWEDMFVPYIDNPIDFKSSAHKFISGRNHVAHSKVLTESSYRKLLSDFEMFDSLIGRADRKYEDTETSDEVLATWDAEEEMRREREESLTAEEEYYRDRLISETGMEILEDDGILDWFDDVITSLYDYIYQQFNFDIGLEISDFSVPSEDGLAFSVQCLAVEDGTAIVEVVTDYDIDSDMGATSTCTVKCLDYSHELLFTAELRFHNGHGFENDEGLMEVDENTEYDDSEIKEFKENLIDAINNLNPYPDILKQLEYESKGCDSFVADFPCEQCGKNGISKNETFLPIGRCCYCGFENELATCTRCDELFNANDIEGGFCSNCANNIEKQ